MPSFNGPRVRSAYAGPVLRVGLVRLVDAAPVLVARELGFLADEGVDIRLSVEPSWANVADKITYGLIDAAIMLPPLAIAVSLGLRGSAMPLVVPISLGLNGNTVTLTADLAGDIRAGDPERPAALEASRRFAALLRARRRCCAPGKPRIAVVHAFSTHNLLLRHWLAAGGIDPDNDVMLTVVPPAEMVDQLSDGRIAGFCAGAPWGAIAARAGVGETAVTTAEIWEHHPEKVLAVRSSWASTHPETLQGVLRGLLRAARFCEAPENASRIMAILARNDMLALDASAVLGSLPGAAAGNSVFFANAATFPWRSHALWFLHQMARWGYLARDTVDAPAVAADLYRPDLYAAAAASLGLPVPLRDTKTEGEHPAAWHLPAYPSDIAMGPDRFCDGASFDPAAAFTPPWRAAAGRHADPSR